MYIKAFRFVTSVTKIGYQYLSHFKHGVIFGARKMGLNISVALMKFWFLHAIISRKYSEYRVYSITTNLRYWWDRKETLKQWGRQRLMKIIKRHKHATLLQTAANFKAGTSKYISVRTFQRTIIDIRFRSRRPTRVWLLTARHNALRIG